MASATPDGGLPALEDGRVEDSGPTGFQRQEEAAALEGQKLPEITVERQVQDLQAQADCLAGVVLKRPASKKGLKRPASASEAAVGTQAVLPRAAGSTGSGTKAAAKAMAKVKTKAKAKAKAVATRGSKEQMRQSILKKVPAKLKRLYKNGCDKCRGRALCTPSCWAKRGFP